MPEDTNRDEKMSQERDSRPRPDPTALTTQQLIRELGSLQTLLETKINNVDSKVEEAKQKIILLEGRSNVAFLIALGISVVSLIIVMLVILIK